MKTKKNFTYGHAIGYGVALEMFLMIIQYLLLALYQYNHPGTDFSFNTGYMMSRGFYIFLVPGFIVCATVVYLLLQKYMMSSFSYLFIMLLTSAAIEVTFYLSISADYQGAFLFSVLDKVIGAGLGVIGYFAVGKSREA